MTQEEEKGSAEDNGVTSTEQKKMNDVLKDTNKNVFTQDEVVRLLKLVMSRFRDLEKLEIEEIEKVRQKLRMKKSERRVLAGKVNIKYNPNSTKGKLQRQGFYNHNVECGLYLSYVSSFRGMKYLENQLRKENTGEQKKP